MQYLTTFITGKIRHPSLLKPMQVLTKISIDKGATVLGCQALIDGLQCPLWSPRYAQYPQSCRQPVGIVQLLSFSA